MKGFVSKRLDEFKLIFNTFFDWIKFNILWNWHIISSLRQFSRVTFTRCLRETDILLSLSSSKNNISYPLFSKLNNYVLFRRGFIFRPSLCHLIFSKVLFFIKKKNILLSNFIVSSNIKGYVKFAQYFFFLLFRLRYKLFNRLKLCLKQVTQTWRKKRKLKLNFFLLNNYINFFNKALLFYKTLSLRRKTLFSLLRSFDLCRFNNFSIERYNFFSVNTALTFHKLIDWWLTLFFRLYLKRFFFGVRFSKLRRILSFRRRLRKQFKFKSKIAVVKYRKLFKVKLHLKFRSMFILRKRSRCFVPVNYVRQVRAGYLNYIRGFIDYYFRFSNSSCRTFFLFPLEQSMTASRVVYVIRRRLSQNYSLNYVLKQLLRSLDRQVDIIGYRISCNGRFSRRQRATHRWAKSSLKGKDLLLLNSASSLIDYSFGEGITRYGMYGIKVWIVRKRKTSRYLTNVKRSSLIRFKKAKRLFSRLLLYKCLNSQIFSFLLGIFFKYNKRLNLYQFFDKSNLFSVLYFGGFKHFKSNIFRFTRKQRFFMVTGLLSFVKKRKIKKKFRSKYMLRLYKNTMKSFIYF
jgi:hypothetical protein